MASSNALLTSVEKLDGRSNFSSWQFSVKALFEHEGLWNAVLGTDVDEQNLIKAKSKLMLLVKPTNLQSFFDAYYGIVYFHFYQVIVINFICEHLLAGYKMASNLFGGHQLFNCGGDELSQMVSKSNTISHCVNLYVPKHICYFNGNSHGLKCLECTKVGSDAEAIWSNISSHSDVSSLVFVHEIDVNINRGSGNYVDHIFGLYQRDELDNHMNIDCCNDVTSVSVNWLHMLNTSTDQEDLQEVTPITYVSLVLILLLLIVLG